MRDYILNLNRYQDPDTNTNQQDPVAVQYARMMNQSYGSTNRPVENYQELRVVSEQPHYVEQQVQQTQQQEEEEYRSYTPKDFEKLSPEQLEEAYQKGQQSLESIQSYLASVTQKRNEKMKSASKPIQQKPEQSIEDNKE